MKSDTPGQVEIISTKLTGAIYKCIRSSRKKFKMNVLHEGKACDCWFLEKKLACSRFLAE